MSDAWSERLSEYLDGSLTALEARALESHLPECETCRQSLAELRIVRSRLSADSLTLADQPTEREWSAIRHSISPRPRRWLVPAAIAASLIGLALVGRFAWRREDPLPPATYLQAVADLEAILYDSKSRLRPETIKALQASLAQIDTAIAQAERALKADPANDYVTRYVGQLREARMMTLRQAVGVVHLRS